MLSGENKIKWWMLPFAGYIGYKLFRYLNWKSVIVLSAGAITGGLVQNPR